MVPDCNITKDRTTKKESVVRKLRAIVFPQAIAEIPDLFELLNLSWKLQRRMF